MNKLYKFLKKLHNKLSKDSILLIYKENNKIKRLGKKTFFEELDEILKDKKVKVVFSGMSNDVLEEFYYWILFKKSKEEIDRLLEEKRFDKSYFIKFRLNGRNTYTLRRLDYTKIDNFDEKLKKKELKLKKV